MMHMKRHGQVINWNKSNTMVFSKDYTECKTEAVGVQLRGRTMIFGPFSQEGLTIWF